MSSCSSNLVRGSISMPSDFSIFARLFIFFAVWCFPAQDREQNFSWAGLRGLEHWRQNLGIFTWLLNNLKGDQRARQR